MIVQGQPDSKGMGIFPFLLAAAPTAVPVTTALTAGAMATGAAAYGFTTCDSWWCWPNIKRSLFYDPESPPLMGPAAITPAAPQAEGSMSIPGAWTVEDLFRTTEQRQADFRMGTAYAAEIAKQAARGGSAPAAVPDPEKEKEQQNVLLLFAGAAAILGLALVMKR